MALYQAACLEPPFAEGDMQTLFKSILYKNPKPIHTCYSPRLQDFIFKMLEKKKNNRPLVIDLIDFFSFSPNVFSLKKNEIDMENYNTYTSQSKEAFDRKRLIESNQVSINDEFSALKKRVVNKAKNFKANYLNYKGSGQKKPPPPAQIASQYGNHHPPSGSAVKSGVL